MDGIVALGLAKADAKKNYAAFTKLRAANLLTRLAPSSTLAIPATAPSADVPTISWSTTQTVSGQIFPPHSGLVTEVGSRGTWDPAQQRLPVSGATGLDFFLTGTTVEINLRTNALATQPIWVWVNGAPITAVPDESQAIPGSAVTNYWVKLTFPTSARRRIEFFAPSVAAWFGVRTDVASLVTPAPRKPVVAFVFDSFGGGSAATSMLLSAPFLISRMLGIEAGGQSVGGTGYTVANGVSTFGGAARVAAVAAFNPELIIMSGSLNDDGASASAVGTAAAAAFAAYATALPTAKLIVFGPQPSSSVGTLSATRAANNAAIAAAAAAAPNVLAYHDMIGTVAGTVPAAYSGSTTYPEGTLSSSLGSVWKVVNGGTSTTGTGASNLPGTSPKWTSQTYAYTGTGKVGTVVGDGTRDIYLYSDGVHPTVEGSAALAIRQANTIRADLLAAAA